METIRVHVKLHYGSWRQFWPVFTPATTCIEQLTNFEYSRANNPYFDVASRNHFKKNKFVFYAASIV